MVGLGLDSWEFLETLEDFVHLDWNMTMKES